MERERGEGGLLAEVVLVEVASLERVGRTVGAAGVGFVSLAVSVREI